MESVDELLDWISHFALAVAVLAALAGTCKLLFTREPSKGVPLFVMSGLLAAFPVVSRTIMQMTADLQPAEEPSPAPPQADPAPRAPIDVPSPVSSPPAVEPAPQPPAINDTVGGFTGPPIIFWIGLATVVAIVVILSVAVILGRRALAGRRQRRELRQEAERLWDLHVRDLNKLKAEYTAFETDPWTAFRRPLMTDVTEPLTAQFHQRFARAQELHTQKQPTNRNLVDLFGDAVREANAAWMAADQHARAVAVPTTTDDERRRLRRAEDALRLALDERTSPAERQVALVRVEQLIAGLTVMPTKARVTLVAELETKTRLALTS